MTRTTFQRTFLYLAALGFIFGALAVAQPASAQLTLPGTCTEDQQCAMPPEEGGSLGLDHGLLPEGSGGVPGLFTFNGEWGLIDSTSNSWTKCANERRDTFDRRSQANMMPVAIIREIAPGTHTVDMEWTSPTGWKDVRRQTFSTATWITRCVGPTYFPMSNAWNAADTGEWRFRFWFDGNLISSQTLHGYLTPIGPRTGSWVGKPFVTGSDCGAARTDYFRTESEIGVKLNWDTVNDPYTNPYKIEFRRPGNTGTPDLTLDRTWPANINQYVCQKVAMSNFRDFPGVWNVQAYMTGYSCANDAQRNCPTSGFDTSFRIVNRVPTVGAIEGPATAPRSGGTWCAPISDADGDTSTVTFTWSDGVTQTFTNVVSGTKSCHSRNFGSLGLVTVTVKACDKWDCSSGTSRTIEIVNQRPTVTVAAKVDKTNVVRGEVVTGTITGTDPDGDRLYCDFDWRETSTGPVTSGGPVNSGTQCAATHKFGTVGSFTPAGRLDDRLGNGDTAFTSTSTVVVTNLAPNKPATPSASTTTFYHKTEYRFTVSNPSDPDGAYDNIYCVFNWGDGSSTTVGPLTQPVSSCEANHAWNTPYTTYPVTVTVRDDEASPLSTTSNTLQVTVGNRQPTYVSGSLDPSSIGRGKSTTASAVARDLEGDSFVCRFDWGDGTSTTTTTLTPSGQGCSASHTYGDTIKSYPVTVAFKDSWPQSTFGATTKIGDVSVVNLAPQVPPAPSCPTNAPHKSTVVCTFRLSDPDAMDTVGGTVDWGDGTTSTIATGSNPRDVSLSHVYATPGLMNVRVKARDNLGAESGYSAMSVVHSTNTAPSLTQADCSPLGQIHRGQTVTCLLRASDAESDRVQFIVNWGDGTSSTSAWVSPGQQTSVSHPYPTAVTAVGQTYGIHVQPKDDWDAAGASHAGSVTIVNRAPGAPTTTATPNPASRIVEVSITVRGTDPDNDQVRYTLDFGDGSTPATSPFVPSGSSYTFKHKYTRIGTYCARATSTDNVPQAPLTSPVGACTNVAVENLKPVAVIKSKNPVAGDNVFLHAPNKASLTADQSYDPDFDGIDTYEWKLFLGPREANQDMGQDRDTISADWFLPAGSYTAQLRVRDQLGAWSDPVQFPFVVV